MLLFGFDVGGTKIEAAILELGTSGEFEAYNRETGEIQSFRILSRRRRPTERAKGYPAILNNMSSLAHEVLDEARLELSDIHAMGMGLPGTIHPQNQTFLLGNTLTFKGHNVAKDLADRLRYEGPVLAENDANCFVLAEALCGSGLHHLRESEKKFEDLTAVGIILGTGCGGGAISNGQLVRGKNGGGAELGHTLLKSGGHPCFCGNQGCAEQYVSGPALEASFARRLTEEVSQVKGASEIFELAEQGESTAMAVVSRYKNYLSIFLGNMATIFDPDYFVLGGGVSEQPMIYENLSARVAQTTFLKGNEIPTYSSQTGSSGGVIGAALLPILNSRSAQS